MRQISDETRRKQHRGEGHGRTYKPWILPREIHGLSTTVNYHDAKAGRTVSLLSQGELNIYLCLQWQDNVADIREQYPLPLTDTEAIAEYYGLRHPAHAGKNVVMTTDFLVDLNDGRQFAVSVKPDKSEIDDRRTDEKLFIEKKYYESQKIPYYVVFKTDIPADTAKNLRLVMKYYSLDDVHSRRDMVLHLIAHKRILTDMNVCRLPLKELESAFVPDEETFEKLRKEELG